MRRKALILLVFLLMLCIVPSSVFANSEYTLAYDGSAGPDSSVGDYTDTWTPDGQYTGKKDTAGEAYVILNFSISPFTELLSFNYSINGGSYYDDDSAGKLWAYDWIAEDWVYLNIFGYGSNVWGNGSISGSQYSNSSQITIKANSTDSDGDAGVVVWVAWLHNIEGYYWHVINTPTFVCIVELFMWPFDTFFIFAGLIMIPTSTLYIVKGGRSELSTDKLFLALVIFFVGLGFFIGGIMP